MDREQSCQLELSDLRARGSQWGPWWPWLLLAPQPGPAPSALSIPTPVRLWSTVVGGGDEEAEDCRQQLFSPGKGQGWALGSTL